MNENEPRLREFWFSTPDYRIPISVWGNLPFFAMISSQFNWYNGNDIQFTKRLKFLRSLSYPSLLHTEQISTDGTFPSDAGRILDKTSGARSLYNTTTTMKRWRTFNALAFLYCKMLRVEVLTIRVRRRNCAQLESWRCAMGLFFPWVRWHTDSHGFEGKTLVENIAQKASASESIGSIKAKRLVYEGRYANPR